MKECDILWGQNILLPLIHFQGVKIPATAPERTKDRVNTKPEIINFVTITIGVLN